MQSPNSDYKTTQKDNQRSSGSGNKKISRKERMKNYSFVAEGYMQCEKVFTELMKHPHAEKFLTLPAETTSGDPLGFKTVELKLKNKVYNSPSVFAQDVLQSFLYIIQTSLNPEEIKIAEEIRTYFIVLMKDVVGVIFDSPRRNEDQEAKKQSTKSSTGLKKSAQGSKANSLDRPMSVTEKSLLRSNILKLPPDKISEMLPIIQDSIDMSNSKESVEFDIDNLPTRKCRELEQFVNACLPKPKSSKVKKVEAKKPSPTQREVSIKI